MYLVFHPQQTGSRQTACLLQPSKEAISGGIPASRTTRWLTYVRDQAATESLLLHQQWTGSGAERDRGCRQKGTTRNISTLIRTYTIKGMRGETQELPDNNWNEQQPATVAVYTKACRLTYRLRSGRSWGFLAMHHVLIYRPYSVCTKLSSQLLVAMGILRPANTMICSWWNCKKGRRPMGKLRGKGSLCCINARNLRPRQSIDSSGIVARWWTW